MPDLGKENKELKSLLAYASVLCDQIINTGLASQHQISKSQWAYYQGRIDASQELKQFLSSRRFGFLRFVIYCLNAFRRRKK